jgi:hypothetical protein
MFSEETIFRLVKHAHRCGRPLPSWQPGAARTHQQPRRSLAARAARQRRPDRNHLYDLDDIEKNHEAFANQGEIAAAHAVKKLLKAESKSRFSLVRAASFAFG